MVRGATRLWKANHEFFKNAARQVSFCDALLHLDHMAAKIVELGERTAESDPLGRDDRTRSFRNARSARCTNDAAAGWGNAGNESGVPRFAENRRTIEDGGRCSRAEQYDLRCYPTRSTRVVGTTRDDWRPHYNLFGDRVRRGAGGCPARTGYGRAHLEMLWERIDQRSDVDPAKVLVNLNICMRMTTPSRF